MSFRNGFFHFNGRPPGILCKITTLFFVLNYNINSFLDYTYMYLSRNLEKKLKLNTNHLIR